jgi:hypothetical protein
MTFSYVWVDFIAGKIDIDEVIAEYQKYNFQAWSFKISQYASL